MFEPLLYAAYGSNLCHARMRGRCGMAEPAGRALLPGWRLSLGRFATIVEDPAAVVPLGLWRITRADLDALDRTEGVAKGIYERRHLTLPDGRSVWIYIERVFRAGPPPEGYVEALRHGYRDFGLDPAVLEAVLSPGGLARVT